MVRTTTGPAQRNKHRRIIAANKGYRGKRKNVFRIAMQAWIKAGQNSYVGRKQKKRDFRRLWITRLSVALRALGGTYSVAKNRWLHAKMEIDRKNLSELLVQYPAVFQKIVDETKAVEKR